MAGEVAGDPFGDLRRGGKGFGVGDDLADLADLPDLPVKGRGRRGVDDDGFSDAHAVRRYGRLCKWSAVLGVPAQGSAAEIGRAHDPAVARMYAEHPAQLRYLRRALIDPEHDNTKMIILLADLTLSQVRGLRAAGISTKPDPEHTQALGILIRELGPDPRTRPSPAATRGRVVLEPPRPGRAHRRATARADDQNQTSPAPLTQGSGVPAVTFSRAAAGAAEPGGVFRPGSAWPPGSAARRGAVGEASAAIRIQEVFCGGFPTADRMRIKYSEEADGEASWLAPGSRVCGDRP
ncbi:MULTISPECIES: hypothetical protein [unclassified Frankia]